MRLAAARSARRRARSVLLALAFISLAFVLLRPFCELTFGSDGPNGVVGILYAGGHASTGRMDGGDSRSGTCCDSVKDGTLLTLVEPTALRAQGGSLAVLAFVSAGLLLLARPRNPAGKFLPAPPERSYYARSARILR